MQFWRLGIRRIIGEGISARVRDGLMLWLMER